jgi:hypothetical protein
MPLAAITYRVKPGYDEEIAAIFAGFQRVNTPVLRDADGNEVGKLLGTEVFLKDDILVRIIHYEGDFAAVGRHMSMQRGVHLLEEKLAPYLAESRDTSKPEGFQSYFSAAVMRCISQLGSAEPAVADRGGPSDPSRHVARSQL